MTNFNAPEEITKQEDRGDVSAGRLKDEPTLNELEAKLSTFFAERRAPSAILDDLVKKYINLLLCCEGRTPQNQDEVRHKYGYHSLFHGILYEISDSERFSEQCALRDLEKLGLVEGKYTLKLNLRLDVCNRQQNDTVNQTIDMPLIRWCTAYGITNEGKRLLDDFKRNH